MAEMNDPEASLVERAKAREPSAWAEIYDTYYRRLYGFCYVRTRDAEAAADLTANVFLEALQQIARYRYRGHPLSAWLYRIARNLVNDYRRKLGRETQAVRRVADQKEEAGRGLAALIADQQDLRAALERLTEDQQQVMALRYFADLTTAEIAVAMERTERAVYSLEARALAALRRALAPPKDPGCAPQAGED